MRILTALLPVLALLAAAVEPATALRADDLQGSWALEMVGRSAAKVAVLGEVESTARTGVLVQLDRQEDGSWVQIHTPCGSRITGGGLVTTRIPSAYFHKVPTKVLAPQITEDGDALRYAVDLGRFIAGWDPTRCSAVPTEVDDPCVLDWDEDGKPAVTIQVKIRPFSWVDVYVAQQTHPALDGHMLGPDRVEGRLRVTEVDNQVLGASNRLFATSPTSRMLDDQCTFSMTRVAATATCAEVLEVLEIDPRW